jgi:multidrug efflux system outer membrane protein
MRKPSTYARIRNEASIVQAMQPRGLTVAAVATVSAPSLLALALAACAVGPDYVRPNAPTQERFVSDDPTITTTTSAQNGENVAIETAQPQAEAEFWRSFNDPLLTRLVEEALTANHDLRIALASYDRANGLLRNAKLDRYPTVTASATASDSRASTDQAPGVPRADRDGESYSVQADVSWELDLFGRVRRNVESQRAEAWATASDLEALQVAIVGEVARSYVELRGLQERLRVARQRGQPGRDAAPRAGPFRRRSRHRVRHLARPRAARTTRSRVPALEALVAVTMHRLAVLTGQTPDALVAELTPQQPLPALPSRLDPGSPGELLRHRPDVIAAEHRLHAATARIGVATADLFPRFTLGGLIGSQAVDTSALFERDSETRFVALGIDWSFLDIGRVRARIAAADANASGELARYQQSVLLALEDTENALVRYARSRVEDQHLEQAALDSATAARLARVRYEAGAADLFEVLDAERTQLVAQEAFADGRTRSASSAVALYKALAGGWPTRMPLREEVARR